MRFHGRIGYVDTVETKPGLWEEQLVFRTYYGDVIRNTKRDSLGSKVNADIQVTNQIRENVKETGYSISAGYAMREKHEELQETIRKSDSRMYEDKAEYYMTNQHDRKKKRDDTARLTE